MGDETKEDVRVGQVNKNEKANDDESEEDSEEQHLGLISGEGEENERGEFVLDAVTQKEVAANEDKGGDSSDEHEDNNRVNTKQDSEIEEEPLMERDFSSYDAWMGILSSSSVKYFVRIVPSSDVGVVSIDRS